MQVWAEPMVQLRLPKIFNLRTDPYEFADITSNVYWDWIFDHAFVLVPAQALVAEFLETLKEFPPRQKAASFSIDQVVEKLAQAASIVNTAVSWRRDQRTEAAARTHAA